MNTPLTHSIHSFSRKRITYSSLPNPAQRYPHSTSKEYENLGLFLGQREWGDGTKVQKASSGWTFIISKERNI